MTIIGCSLAVLERCFPAGQVGVMQHSPVDRLKSSIIYVYQIQPAVFLIPEVYVIDPCFHSRGALSRCRRSAVHKMGRCDRLHLTVEAYK